MLAGAGVVLLGFALPRGARAGQAAAPPPPAPVPDAFIRIGADDTVTLVIKHIEFGQGIATGLATLLAEEMDADWANVRIAFAPNDAALYKNLNMGTMGTGGSSGIANSYLQMRRNGAAARAMLVAAAAQRWSVPAGEVTVAKGVVRSGRHSARFGELAESARVMPVPGDPPLKDPAAFTLIGHDLPKIDTKGKTDGSAVYTMDVRLPGMVYAVILHPPAFGATVASFDASAAQAVPGVLAVKQVPSGIAVIARDTWSAQKGRNALAATWDFTHAERRSSAQIAAEHEAAASQPAPKAIEAKGDVAAALPPGAHMLEATYRFPYLAHAPMEPMDAVVQVKDGRLDVWMGSQFQNWDTEKLAQTLGIAPENAHLHECFAGGSFGRRATLGNEFPAEAGEIVKVWGRPEPIKFVWTRENDLTGGFYRPLMVHKLKGAVDGQGRILLWDQTVAGQSFVFGSKMSAMAEKKGYDGAMVEGSSELLYRVDAHRLGAHVMQSPVTTNWWRSVGFSHNAYVVETFVDELLQLAGQDAVAGRLASCDDPRAAGVLKRVAADCNWGGPVPAGRARGVAMMKSFKSYVAQVAEVSRGSDGLPKVHKVWAAVDCGVPVNPDVIRAQVEGGIGFALGHILYAEVELEEGGAVRQRNFDRYRSLRIGEMPDVQVSVLPSTMAPTGIGEPGVPPLGPAVANAWRRLTGQAVRDLPFAKALKA